MNDNRKTREKQNRGINKGKRAESMEKIENRAEK
jgi:hypothetical protein